MRSPRLPISPRASTLAPDLGSTLSMAKNRSSPRRNTATCRPSTSAQTPVWGTIASAAQTVVQVEVLRDGLTVRDWGPGVDGAQLPLLFERFWRGAHRRDHGAGLGLAICQEIAQAHGWQLSAERAEPGLRFRLSHATVP